METRGGNPFHFVTLRSRAFRGILIARFYYTLPPTYCRGGGSQGHQGHASHLAASDMHASVTICSLNTPKLQKPLKSSFSSLQSTFGEVYNDVVVCVAISTIS